jgi:mono/diheme cytochrome c family protein
MPRVGVLVIAALAHLFICVPAVAQEAQGKSPGSTPEQVRLGAEIYERNCSPCHGPRMQDPEGAFDLRTFPPDQRTRFIDSVARGKNSMPPWGGLLKPEEIEALWAHVVAGERSD